MEVLELELVSHQAAVAQIAAVRVSLPEHDVDLADRLESVLEVIDLVQLLVHVLSGPLVERRPPPLLGEAALRSLRAQRDRDPLARHPGSGGTAGPGTH